jgi:hypothetical protein
VLLEDGEQLALLAEVVLVDLPEPLDESSEFSPGRRRTRPSSRSAARRADAMTEDKASFSRFIVSSE